MSQNDSVERNRAADKLDQNAMSGRKILGIVIAVLIVAVSHLVPETEMLPRAGITTIAVLLSFLVMLIAEVLPLMLTCLIFVGLMPLLGITSNFNTALVGFSNQVVFFVFASCGIAQAIIEVPLANRILMNLLKVFGKNVRSMLFAIMLGTALVSSCMSNVPTCAIFMAIGLSFLQLYEDDSAKKRTGRAFMIAIPVASMVGGMITPAGSSINLLAISLLEQYTGHTISFVQWMAAGIPLTIIILPAAWILMVMIYKPAEINRDIVKNFLQTLQVPPKMDGREKKVVAVVAVMFVLWVLSSWVRSINVMVVALLGCCVFFLPGIGVLNLKKFLRENNWDPFFLLGTVMSLGTAMVSNGVSNWMVSLMPVLNIPPFALIGATALFMFVMLIIIPVAPSLVTIVATPLIAVAAAANVAPELLLLTCGLCAGNCYLIPLDTVPLLTYGTGYYSMTDMVKSTIWVQLVVVAAMAIWLPVIGRIFGWL
jgi:sodium-dependent dicarboxylate transporter 2/3/5